MFGKSDVRDEDDNQYTRGDLSWSPTYAYYTWDPPAGTQLSPLQGPPQPMPVQPAAMPGPGAPPGYDQAAAGNPPYPLYAQYPPEPK